MELKRIRLPFRAKKTVLGLGAQTKNTICFIKGGFAYLSPVHADLSNPKDLFSFEKDALYFLKKYPKIIAYDLHPEYQSTKFSLDLSPITYRLSPIQHHHSHIVSCMVENGLKNQKVIGVAFDGTGLGEGNTLWGGEFLLCDFKSFQRKAHLQEIPLLGGEKAISEPGRLALAWLYLVYKDGLFNLGIDFVKGIDKKKWRVLKDMYLKGFNAPLASSMGRLFDAVASLTFAKYRAKFEAELAIELEKKASAWRPPVQAYDFKITKGKGGYTLSPLPMFKQIVSGLKQGQPQANLAYGFHLTVAQMLKKVCLILRQASRINKVALSGGVFQNKLLLNLSLGLLYKEGFQVLTHKDLSCNDSGVSLGQAVIASSRASY